MDFAETDEHQLLRGSVGDVAAQFGHRYYADAVRNGAKLDELWDALGELGFLGVHLPEQYGGGGAGITELAIVCEEVATAGCPLLLILVSAAICAELIANFGTDEQRAEWLPSMSAGGKMAFAITETDAGSNTHRLHTTAVRDGDVYRLNGGKTFISGVDEAEQILVVVRTGTDEASGRALLSLLIVDTASAGLESVLIPVEIASPEKQFTLFFDNVEVPVSRRLGDEGDGLRVVFHGLNPERITGAALCAGIGRYALARAAEYATDRRVWDVPIGSHQGISHPLAEAKIELELARLMMMKAAWAHDHDGSGSIAAEASNMAKYAAAEAGYRCLDIAIQTHGGNGMTSEYGLADMWGLSRLLRIAPVSREMILNFVAQHTLSLPRSY
ncbi:MAG: Butyryl-CoA dehydrogenase [Acidimicrobiales bacterium]|nr:Butyryl-CoA dehydrogenase [Acidimicrobiales bacterium]